MKFEILQTTPEHIIDNIFAIKKESPYLLNDDFKISDLITAVKLSYAFSTFKDSEFICAAGIFPQTYNQGLFWWYWTDRIQQNAIGLIKLAKSEIDAAAERLKLVRIESWVELNNTQHRKMNELCGFTLETEVAKKKWYDGKDCHIYVKIY